MAVLNVTQLKVIINDKYASNKTHIFDSINNIYLPSLYNKQKTCVIFYQINIPTNNSVLSKSSRTIRLVKVMIGYTTKITFGILNI